jgi:hypothetical protein
MKWGTMNHLQKSAVAASPAAAGNQGTNNKMIGIVGWERNSGQATHSTARNQDHRMFSASECSDARHIAFAPSPVGRRLLAHFYRFPKIAHVPKRAGNFW